jgi:DNA-binding MarR family transcriptional regulator
VKPPHRAAQATAAAGDGFDQLIHAQARLRVCAALDPVREIEFGALLTLTDMSKSALSKHLTALAEAGYLTQRRAVRDTRQRVWLRLTPTGCRQVPVSSQNGRTSIGPPMMALVLDAQTSAASRSSAATMQKPPRSSAAARVRTEDPGSFSTPDLPS